MSIHEQLPPEVKRELKQVGWTKGLELAKLARAKEGRIWIVQPGCTNRRALPGKSSTGTGKGTDRKGFGTVGDYLFQAVQSQIPVVEQAIETAALILGSKKSRGYCLEMICADFLAGASLDGSRPEVLLNTLSTLFQFLPGEQ